MDQKITEKINFDNSIAIRPEGYAYEVINFNFYLDGLSVPYQIIDSNFDNILYSDFPDTSNVYCFTSLQNYENYLALNPYKDSILRDIHIMDSLGIGHENELMERSPEFDNAIGILSGNVAVSCWNTASPPSGNVYYIYPHTSLGDHNNKISLINIISTTTNTYSFFNTKKFYKGSRAIFWAYLPVINAFDLTRTKWDDNFMSIY